LHPSFLLFVLFEALIASIILLIATHTDFVLPLACLVNEGSAFCSRMVGYSVTPELTLMRTALHHRFTTSSQLQSVKKNTCTPGLPKLGATSVGTAFLEVGRSLEKACSFWMSLTLNRKAIVEVLPLLKKSKEWHPCIFSSLAIHEGI